MAPPSEVAFLDAEARKYPAIGERYKSLKDLYEARLWHQLTDEISEFVVDPACKQGRNLIELYEKFISKFEKKLNQLRFVQIASVIAQQFSPSIPIVKKEVEGALSFMQAIVEKRDQLGDEAFVVAQMAVAELLIRHGSHEYVDRAKALLDEVQPILQHLAGTGAETIANSSYYRVSCEYRKVRGPSDEFYKAAIQFLAYTPIETLGRDKQVELAIDMSLAALVGEGVYNFGEVLAQPLLSVLDDTEFRWLYDLLKIFSAGDIDGFAMVFQDNEKKIKEQPLLAKNMELLRQKIGLLCLMKLIFNRPPEERNIDLEDIADATRLESDHIEWMLMRAMSKGLIKGKIDGVDRVVHISWLKPRVLDADQMTVLDEKLTAWKENVRDTLLFIEGETPELFQ